MLLPPINDDRKIHLEFNIEMFPFNATRYQFETFSLDTLKFREWILGLCVPLTRCYEFISNCL